MERLKHECHGWNINFYSGSCVTRLGSCKFCLKPALGPTHFARFIYTVLLHIVINNGAPVFLPPIWILSKHICCPERRLLPLKCFLSFLTWREMQQWVLTAFFNLRSSSLVNNPDYHRYANKGVPDSISLTRSADRFCAELGVSVLLPSMEAVLIGLSPFPSCFALTKLLSPLFVSHIFATYSGN